MKQISYTELASHFHPEVHDSLERVASHPGATHLVLFQNQALDSANAGLCSALAIGPGCTRSSLEEAYAGHLNDLPSQRQYPIAHCELPHANNPASD
jgi:hypothetical protein